MIKVKEMIMKRNKVFFCSILCMGVIILSSCDKNMHHFIDATCTEPKRCIDCGQTEGEPLGHQISEWIIDIEGTCTTEGKQHKECIRCQKILEEKNIELVEHTWKEADCYNPRTCVVCEITEGTSLEHQFSKWDVICEPTYDELGEKMRSCLNCGKKETEAIEKLNPQNHIEEIIKKVQIPEETKENLVLPTLVDDVTITWSAANTKLISNTGIIKRGPSNVKTALTATFSFHQTEYSVEYKITILGYTIQEKLQIAMDTIYFPEIAYGDIEFSGVYIYGVRGSFESSNVDAIDNEGKIHLSNVEENVILKVKLVLEDETLEKEFEIKVPSLEKIEKKHQLLIRSSTLENVNDNMKIIDGKLVLNENILEGSYESNIIETSPFRSLVCSWAALSSKNATVELFIKVLVDGVWSDYVTYSPWGLGLQNASHDQNNGIIQLSTDEVIVLNSKTATAIQYQVVLKRALSSVESPKLSLVSFALEIPNYNYYVDTSNLKESVCYDVPRLCQNVVPTIGGSICSATSTTMLLKYKGLDFTTFDNQYEHRYIASIVKDYGNNIYGNWVYNTVTMGGYGFDAYVARMYSINELLYHLSNVGPVALSVKGTMISSEKTYTTNGHLIVAIGYKMVDEKLYILCNDPNVANVYCEYSVDVIENTWRNIAYIIE